MSAFKSPSRSLLAPAVPPSPLCLPRCPRDSDGSDTDTEAKGTFPLEPWPWLSAIYSLGGFTLPKVSWSYELWHVSDRVLDWTCSHRGGWKAPSPPHLPVATSLLTWQHTVNSWHQNWVLNIEQVCHKACHWFTGHSHGPWRFQAGYLKKSLGLNEGKLPQPANSKCDKQSEGK